jgi:single-strand DNA-binding protein
MVAGSVNKVILVGNVGKDPEDRSTQDGMKIVNFSLATSESWTDRASGERKERTEWHRVVCFNDKKGEVIEKYVRKGSKVYIEGQLQTRKWTDQTGNERYSTEVVLPRFGGELTLLDGKKPDQPSEDRPATTPTRPYAGQKSGYTPNKNLDLDDDIPF